MKYIFRFDVLQVRPQLLIFTLQNLMAKNISVGLPQPPSVFFTFSLTLSIQRFPSLPGLAAATSLNDTIWTGLFWTSLSEQDGFEWHYLNRMVLNDTIWTKLFWTTLSEQRCFERHYLNRIVLNDTIWTRLFWTTLSEQSCFKRHYLNSIVLNYTI